MAVDLEGCQHDRRHYGVSLSVVNQRRETVYDVYIDHGREKGEDERLHSFINRLPPESKGFQVNWEDLKPWNGARPVKEVIRNVAKLFEGRTIVMHDAGADQRMLNASSVRAGIKIAWETVRTHDTQKSSGWQQYALGQNGPSLKRCAAYVIGDWEFQSSVHRSLEDAEMTMRLYLKEQEAIEAQRAGHGLAVASSNVARLTNESSPRISALVDAMARTGISMDAVVTSSGERREHSDTGLWTPGGAPLDV